jgi:hypothetical protein
LKPAAKNPVGAKVLGGGRDDRFSVSLEADDINAREKARDRARQRQG